MKTVTYKTARIYTFPSSGRVDWDRTIHLLEVSRVYTAGDLEALAREQAPKAWNRSKPQISRWLSKLEGCRWKRWSARSDCHFVTLRRVSRGRYRLELVP